MDQQQAPASPQWSPPPQQPAGWGGPGYGGAPIRPTGVTLSGIYLIVMGVLVALFLGGCGLLVGGSVGFGGSDFANAVGGSVTAFGVIALVIGIAGIAGGAGAMTGSSWARWLGIIVSVLSILFFGLLMLGFFSVSGGSGFAILFALIVVFYILVIVSFVRASMWFAPRRR